MFSENVKSSCEKGFVTFNRSSLILKLNKYFYKKVGFSYQEFGFLNLEEFNNKINNNDKETLHALLMICLSKNLTDYAMREVIDACASINDVTALKLLVDGYLDRHFGYELDTKKAKEVLKKLVDEFNDEDSELDLAEIYLISKDPNEHSLGLEMNNKIGNENPRLAYLIGEMYFNNEEFNEAIKFFKLSRIHIVECGIDYYDKLDDEGVMYYVYPLIARACEHLEEFEKAEEYWEKAFKEGIPDAIIVHSYQLMIEKNR